MVWEKRAEYCSEVTASPTVICAVKIWFSFCCENLFMSSIPFIFHNFQSASYLLESFFLPILQWTMKVVPTCDTQKLWKKVQCSSSSSVVLLLEEVKIWVVTHTPTPGDFWYGPSYTQYSQQMQYSSAWLGFNSVFQQLLWCFWNGKCAHLDGTRGVLKSINVEKICIFLSQMVSAWCVTMLIAKYYQRSWL